MRIGQDECPVYQLTPNFDALLRADVKEVSATSQATKGRVKLSFTSSISRKMSRDLQNIPYYIISDRC